MERGHGSGVEKRAGEERLAPGSEGARSPGEPCSLGLRLGEVWGLRGGCDARGGNPPSAPLDRVAQRLQQQVAPRGGGPSGTPSWALSSGLEGAPKGQSEWGWAWGGEFSNTS